MVRLANHPGGAQSGLPAGRGLGGAIAQQPPRKVRFFGCAVRCGAGIAAPRAHHLGAGCAEFVARANPANSARQGNVANVANTGNANADHDAHPTINAMDFAIQKCAAGQPHRPALQFSAGTGARCPLGFKLHRLW